MNTCTVENVAAPSRARRFLRFALIRMVVAIFMTALAGGLTLAYAGKLAHLRAEVMWPELLAAAAVLLSYGLYVRVFERRPVTELGSTRALHQFGAGLLIGTALVTTVVALLTTAEGYRVVGSNGLSMAVITPLAMMIFVGVFEEILSRGIVFRIAEQSLGSWAALVISSLLFGLAHLPGEGASVLSIAVTIVAGVLFAAAYLLTRKLWLGIGIHVAWNYTLGSIYSVAVSGREAKGLLRATVSGPDWLTGGAYGLEASVFTLIVLAAVAGYLLCRAWVKGHFLSARWRRLVRTDF
jgi:CAAX protease family protein